jgi:putative flippase GtrA
MPQAMKRGKPHALLRYLAVGVAATAAHWAFMVMLVEQVGTAPWLASGAGAALGAQVAFLANRSFTFEHAGDRWPAWWRFMATAVLGAVVGMAIVAFGVKTGAHYMLAQALATLVGVLLTFAVNRAWTFAR